MVRVGGFLAVLVIAFLVLLVSILKTAIPIYSFQTVAAPNNSLVLGSGPESRVEYYFPYPGWLPDHPLWFVKAARDWMWLLVGGADHARRAELLLLFADKRLMMAQTLVEKGNANLGVPTAIKAEQYLGSAFDEQEKAGLEGVDTTGFLQRLSVASLKHKEILDALLLGLPEEARPLVNQTGDVPKYIYQRSVNELNKKGRPVPHP